MKYDHETTTRLIARYSEMQANHVENPIDDLAVEFSVPSTLLFPYPQDYVNWISLCIVSDGQLIPILINKGINTAESITNSDGVIEFDPDGNLVSSTSTNNTNAGNCYKIDKGGSGTQNALTVKGQAVFNDLQGRISFGSDMIGSTIVLEYYSDGLFAWGLTDAQLTAKKLKPILIHKDLKEVLTKFVYQDIIGYRRNVPANEKQRARLEYKTYLHQAKLDRLNFNLYTVAKLVR